jgi:hypothetical protein
LTTGRSRDLRHQGLPQSKQLRVWRNERLALALHAIVADQLVRGLLLATFWEGAATATGTKQGVCFVDETS